MNSRSLYLVILLLVALVVYLGTQLLRQSHVEKVLVVDGGQYEVVSNDYEQEHIHESAEIDVTDTLVQRAESSVATEYAYGSAQITTDDVYRYIISNGIPEHVTGDFPNPGNPNSIAEQDHNFRVPLEPVLTGQITEQQLPGVALNGVPLEPGTAEFYNNDRSSGWKIEAFIDGVGGLGIDWSNAHVQPNGTYHYHAVPEGLLEDALEDQVGDLILLAWAADGFPMYWSQSGAYTSGYEIKEGIRQSGPGGVYDGTYTQDYKFAGSGNLDECNGTYVDGSYVYIITDSFPFITRCLKGEPDDSFTKNMTAGAPPQSAGAPAAETQASPGNPPAEAINACAHKSVGSSCSISTPQGMLSGSCLTPPSQTQLACVPS